MESQIHFSRPCSRAVPHQLKCALGKQVFFFFFFCQNKNSYLNNVCEKSCTHIWIIFCSLTKKCCYIGFPSSYIVLFCPHLIQITILSWKLMCLKNLGSDIFLCDVFKCFFVSMLTSTHFERLHDLQYAKAIINEIFFFMWDKVLNTYLWSFR